jgi:hypothetical protein
MCLGISLKIPIRKGMRLQGLKDRLVVSDDPEAEVLRQESSA